MNGDGEPRLEAHHLQKIEKILSKISGELSPLELKVGRLVLGLEEGKLLTYREMSERINLPREEVGKAYSRVVRLLESLDN